MVGDETMSTTLAIGVGCRLGCEAQVIEALVRQALERCHADWNLVYLARSSRERSRSACDAGEGLPQEDPNPFRSARRSPA